MPGPLVGHLERDLSVAGSSREKERERAVSQLMMSCLLYQRTTDYEINSEVNY